MPDPKMPSPTDATRQFALDAIDEIMPVEADPIPAVPDPVVAAAAAASPDAAVGTAQTADAAVGPSPEALREQAEIMASLEQQKQDWIARITACRDVKAFDAVTTAGDKMSDSWRDCPQFIVGKPFYRTLNDSHLDDAQKGIVIERAFRLQSEVSVAYLAKKAEIYPDKKAAQPAPAGVSQGGAIGAVQTADAAATPDKPIRKAHFDLPGYKLIGNDAAHGLVCVRPSDGATIVVWKKPRGYSFQETIGGVQGPVKGETRGGVEVLASSEGWELRENRKDGQTAASLEAKGATVPELPQDGFVGMYEGPDRTTGKPKTVLVLRRGTSYYELHPDGILGAYQQSYGEHAAREGLIKGLQRVGIPYKWDGDDPTVTAPTSPATPAPAAPFAAPAAMPDAAAAAAPAKVEAAPASPEVVLGLAVGQVWVGKEEGKKVEYRIEKFSDRIYDDSQPTARQVTIHITKYGKQSGSRSTTWLLTTFVAKLGEGFTRDGVTFNAAGVLGGAAEAADSKGFLKEGEMGVFDMTTPAGLTGRIYVVRKNGQYFFCNSLGVVRSEAFDESEISLASETQRWRKVGASDIPTPTDARAPGLEPELYTNQELQAGQTWYRKWENGKTQTVQILEIEPRSLLRRGQRRVTIREVVSNAKGEVITTFNNPDLTLEEVRERLQGYTRLREVSAPAIPLVPAGAAGPGTGEPSRAEARADRAPRVGDVWVKHKQDHDYEVKVLSISDAAKEKDGIAKVKIQYLVAGPYMNESRSPKMSLPQFEALLAQGYTRKVEGPVAKVAERIEPKLVSTPEPVASRVEAAPAPGIPPTPEAVPDPNSPEGIIARLRAEVTAARTAFIECEESQRDAWTRLTRIFHKLARRESDDRELKQHEEHYNAAIAALRNEQLEQLRKSGMKIQELRPAMAGLVREHEFMEGEALYGARREARKVRTNQEGSYWKRFKALYDAPAPDPDRASFGEMNKAFMKLMVGASALTGEAAVRSFEKLGVFSNELSKKYGKYILTATVVTGGALVVGGLTGGTASLAVAALALKRALGGAGLAVLAEGGGNAAAQWLRERGQKSEKVEKREKELLDTLEYSEGNKTSDQWNLTKFEERLIQASGQARRSEKSRRAAEGLRKTAAVGLGVALGSGAFSQYLSSKVVGFFGAQPEEVAAGRSDYVASSLENSTVSPTPTVSVAEAGIPVDQSKELADVVERVDLSGVKAGILSADLNTGASMIAGADEGMRPTSGGVTEDPGAGPLAAATPVGSTLDKVQINITPTPVDAPQMTSAKASAVLEAVEDTKVVPPVTVAESLPVTAKELLLSEHKVKSGENIWKLAKAAIKDVPGLEGAKADRFAALYVAALRDQLESIDFEEAKKAGFVPNGAGVVSADYIQAGAKLHLEQLVSGEKVAELMEKAKSGVDVLSAPMEIDTPIREIPIGEVDMTPKVGMTLEEFDAKLALEQAHPSVSATERTAILDSFQTADQPSAPSAELLQPGGNVDRYLASLSVDQKEHLLRNIKHLGAKLFQTDEVMQGHVYDVNYDPLHHPEFMKAKVATVLANYKQGAIAYDRVTDPFHGSQRDQIARFVEAATKALGDVAAPGRSEAMWQYMTRVLAAADHQGVKIRGYMVK